MSAHEAINKVRDYIRAHGCFDYAYAELVCQQAIDDACKTLRDKLAGQKELHETALNVLERHHKAEVERLKALLAKHGIVDQEKCSHSMCQKTGTCFNGMTNEWYQCQRCGKRLQVWLGNRGWMNDEQQEWQNRIQQAIDSAIAEKQAEVERLKVTITGALDKIQELHSEIGRTPLGQDNWMDMEAMLRMLYRRQDNMLFEMRQALEPTEKPEDKS